MKYFLAFLSTSLLYSCMPILMVAYGVSKPKNIDTRKLNKEIKKYELTEYDHLLTDSLGVFQYLSNSFSTSSNTSSSVNNLFILTKNGIVFNNSDTDCSSANLAEILNKTDSLYQSPALHGDLDYFRECISFHDRDGKPFDLNFDENQAYILLTWASYAGRLNKNITQEYVKQLEEINPPKTKILYFNVDFVEMERL